jgi:hypothetical protein
MEPQLNSLSALLLDGADFSRHAVIGSDGQATGVLSSLSRVNFFVGPNNSGKSTFLRQILRIDKYRFGPVGGFSEIAKLAADFKSGVTAIAGRGIQEISGLVTGVANLPRFDIISEGDKPFAELVKWVDFAAAAKSTDLNVSSSSLGGMYDFDGLALRLRQLGAEIKPQLDAAIAAIPKTNKLLRLYIPTLRGLRPFANAGDCYAVRTQTDYFPTTPVPAIFTGLTLRDEVEELQMGDFAARKSVERFQNFLSKEFFNGEPVYLLPRKGKDVLYVKIGDEVELPVYELGDGIQMIIITTFPLFKNDAQASVVCIEEPELYLHPGFQRVLLKTLTSFPRNIYFIATHSNHLLDLTLDFEGVSIFTFCKSLEDSEQPERRARFTIERVSSHDHRTLQLLGTRNSSVFLSNCTIWVEGITDRRYLSHYLDLYQQSLSRSGNGTPNPPFIAEEDLHYSFVEYAGSNITHWSFLDEVNDPIEVERVCSRLFLVTDRDDQTNQTKVERHEKLAAKLGPRYYRLECREVENLIAPAILHAVVGGYEGANAKLNSVTYQEYKNEPLGTFIETRLLKEKQRKGRYATDSGAVTDKLMFCERAIEATTALDQLTEEAQELTKRLYSFIRQENCK